MKKTLVLFMTLGGIGLFSHYAYSVIQAEGATHNALESTQSIKELQDHVDVHHHDLEVKSHREKQLIQELGWFKERLTAIQSLVPPEVLVEWEEANLSDEGSGSRQQRR